MTIKAGTRVRVTDRVSKYYNQIGVCEEATRRGWYVRHDDGALCFHPWGLERVSQEIHMKKLVLAVLLGLFIATVVVCPVPSVVYASEGGE